MSIPIERKCVRCNLDKESLQGTETVIIDNVRTFLGGPALQSVLTAEQRIGRKLGTSSQVLGDVRLTLLATGNNLRLEEDTVRRSLRLDLVSAADNPADRCDFTHVDIDSWTIANRSRLVSAAITLCKAYRDAGCPAQNLPPFGSFSAWSDSVRAPIVWAGGQDPCDVRLTMAADLEPEEEAWRRVVHAAVECFGDGSFTAKELCEVACGTGYVEPEAAAGLHEAFATLTRSSGPKVQPIKLSNVLQRYANSVHQGTRLERDSDCPQYVTRWKAAPVHG